MTEPIEISIPPVISTNVIPTAAMINPALLMNKFKNTCGLVKFRADVGKSSVNAHAGGVRLRRGRKQDAGLGQWELRLGQTELKRGVHTGLDDRHSQRVGKADVLACRAEDAPASADEVADLEEPRKVMQRCIRVRAAQRFHESGENVIMVVTVAVIAHGAALSYRGGVLGGDDAALPRGGEEQLDGVAL